MTTRAPRRRMWHLFEHAAAGAENIMATTKTHPDRDAEEREMVGRYLDMLDTQPSDIVDRSGNAPRAYSPIDLSTSVVPSVLSWIGLIVILWCALFALPLIIGLTLARWMRGPA